MKLATYALPCNLGHGNATQLISDYLFLFGWKWTLGTMWKEAFNSTLGNKALDKPTF